MTFTEYRTVEKEILDNLQTPELGWRFENRYAVASKYRASGDDEMLLLPILRQKLKDLNPAVITDEERADAVITRLRALRDNQEWLAWLRNEKTMQFAVDEKHQTIKLIDYENIGANDFLVTNQFTIDDNSYRPDIILLINGVPVVDVEAKTASRGQIDWAEGAKQIGRYAEKVPKLYYSNAFCVGVNEIKMKYGVPGARLQQWQQWRDPYPHTHIDSFNEMMCSVYGLFDRHNLLDIIRNFIVFEVERGQLVKKVARYQQYRAANKIVERALDIELPAGERRGLVWHNQGSGKSLTMLFAARKMWNHPELHQPTVIIVVDRDQLQDQMSKELYATNTENCVIADSIPHLREMLGKGDGHRGVIVTIINKFDRMDAELSSRRNIIMLVDEAHRTQYGNFGIFMRSAMPNASIFGLTGTPLELKDRNTMVSFGKQLGPERFERYMDKYTNADSIRDGATLKIHFEPRLTDWSVWGEELDKKFEALFSHLSEEERAKLKTEEAKLDVILKHPKRIAQISQDIAEHFTERIQPNGFKAMVVCRDKETCALYKAALDSLLGAEASLIIISEDRAHDKDLIKQHYLGDARRKKAIDDFKRPKPETEAELEKPENEFARVEILIVCDMLLTGFDAPILEVMYLDRSLRDHTLLQAIARVNRPYNDLKQYGLIVDYFGVFENLNEALNFDRDELGEVIFPFNQLREKFREEIDKLSQLLKGFDRSGTHASLMKILIFFNENEQAREQFELGYRNTRILFETLQPDEFLRPFLDEYTWLCKLYVLYQNKFYPREHFDVDEVDGAKTRDLIREHVDVEELRKDFPTYVFGADFLTKVKNEEPDAKALDIEAMLASELKIRVEEDEDLRPLSERLKIIIERKRAGALAGITLIEELEKLTRQVVEVVEESRRPVANSIAKAVKERVPETSEERAIEVAEAIVAKAQELCFEGWFRQSHMDTELFQAFTILLAKNFRELDLHVADSDFVERCIKLLKKVRFNG